MTDDLAPSGFPRTPHGADPSVPYLDHGIGWLQQRAANARREQVGLTVGCDQWRYWNAVATQASNEAAARQRSQDVWNKRALEVRAKAAGRMKDAAE